MTESNSMTKSERAELGKVVRFRAKVAKDDIESHAARVLATIEAQLAAYAERVIAEANTQIAQRCREFGIPECFHPSISYYWRNRGENTMKDRRAELRKVAQTECAARVKAAKNTVDRRTADLLTQLAEGTLASSQAKDFLNTMPSVDDLMPQITLDDLKAIAPSFILGGGW